MDPLTHTLVGANLASTRLGRVAPGAAAALIIGANAPDIDVAAYLLGEDFGTGFRRGWTHGLPALLILPVILAASIAIWKRLRHSVTPSRDETWRLLGVSFLAVATHPFLDWLNTYGMRWLMPLEPTWFYGDSVFIMDPWLWLLLAVPWLAQRSPSRGIIGGWLLVSLLLASVVLGRNGSLLWVVGTVSAITLAAIAWRPAGDSVANLHRAGVIAITLASLYIGGMIVLHDQTERILRTSLPDAGITPAGRLMTAPMPVNSLAWDFVVETDAHYRYGRWSWIGQTLEISDDALPRPVESEAWRTARSDPSIEGFMRWVRFPWYVVEHDGAVMRVHIFDARYVREPRPDGGFGSATVELTR